MASSPFSTFLFRVENAPKDMMSNIAIGHQSRYIKRLNLTSVRAVHMVYLIIYYMVVPWFRNAKCDHHFENDGLKIEFDPSIFV